MFKDIINEGTDINEEITLEHFIDTVQTYNDINEALLDLDESYMQFFIDNEDVVYKSLLMDITEDDTQATIGTSRTDDRRYKTIKYKGNYITLIYDPDLGSWFPTVRFRSIIPALKYGKALADSVL